MASYRLVVRKSVAKDLRPLPNKDIERILRRITGLIDDPRPAGCEKLSAQEKYQVRQGAYRIVYAVEDNELIVTVVRVGHRRHVYKNSQPCRPADTRTLHCKGCYGKEKRRLRGAGNIRRPNSRQTLLVFPVSRIRFARAASLAHSKMSTARKSWISFLNPAYAYGPFLDYV